MLGLFVTGLLIYLTSGSTDNSCVNRCGDTLDTSKSCQCNEHCVRYDDCCSDFTTVCKGSSCVGRCNSDYDSSQPCQCNSLCSRYKNCCSDIHLCPGHPTGTESPQSSDIFQQLWDADTNRLTSTDYTIDPQGKTTSNSHEDLAPNRLFSSIDFGIFQHRPTFHAFVALLDNYNIHNGQVEDLTPHEWNEIEHYLDVVLQTSVMVKTYQYLHNNNKVTSESDFRSTLKELWFNLYARSSTGVVDSSGFEHVMTGELKATSVNGFHNWIQFYFEEEHGNIDYKGYVNRKEPSLLAAHFTWHGLWKNLGSFFIGTSPEFDMAVFTICLLTDPNSKCSFFINGHKVEVQTWDVAHKQELQIASAYPIV